MFCSKLNSAAQQCSPQFGIVTATGTGSSTDTAAFTANGRARVEYSSSNDASGKLQVALDITKLAFPMPVNALYNGLASSTASGQKGAALPLFRCVYMCGWFGVVDKKSVENH